jgi:putative MATE family efflux protein
MREEQTPLTGANPSPTESTVPAITAGLEPLPAAAVEESEAAAPAVVRKGAVDLTQGHLLRGIWLLSWPIVTGSVLNWLMGVADIRMVGRLGPEAIAAVGQSQNVLFLVMALVLAVATGTQVLVARYTGSREPGKVAEVTRQTIIMCVVAGLIVTPVGLWVSRGALGLLGVTGTVLDLGATYTRICFWGAIAMNANFLLMSALQGAGDTRTPLYLLIVMNLLHIGIEWVLIFGVGPFPALGVAGAAWAVVSSRFITAFWMLWVITCGRFAVTVPLRGSWRVDWDIWGKMLYIGVPSSLQGLTRSLGYSVLVYVLNHTVAGFYAVTGHTAAGQWNALGIFAGLSMMTAAMTAVGQNMGARNPDRAERSCYQVARISLTMSSVLAGLCIIFATPLVAFFTDDPQARHWGVWALVIISASLPFATVSMAFSGALRGAGDTMSPMWATLVCTLVIGPVLGYVLALTLGMGPIGAWLGLVAAMVAQAAITWFIFRRGRWRTIRL